jgi:hypothetical protein
MQEYATTTPTNPSPTNPSPTNPSPTNPRIRFRASREPSALRRFITPAHTYYIQRRPQIGEYEAYGNDAPEEMDNILY